MKQLPTLCGLVAIFGLVGCLSPDGEPVACVGREIDACRRAEAAGECRVGRAMPVDQAAQCLGELAEVACAERQAIVPDADSCNVDTASGAIYWFTHPERLGATWRPCTDGEKVQTQDLRSCSDRRP